MINFLLDGSALIALLLSKPGADERKLSLTARSWIQSISAKW